MSGERESTGEYLPLNWAYGLPEYQVFRGHVDEQRAVEILRREDEEPYRPLRLEHTRARFVPHPDMTPQLIIRSSGRGTFPVTLLWREEVPSG